MSKDIAVKWLPFILSLVICIAGISIAWGLTKGQVNAIASRVELLAHDQERKHDSIDLTHKEMRKHMHRIDLKTERTVTILEHWSVHGIGAVPTRKEE